MFGLERMWESSAPTVGHGGKLYGVYTALVIDLDDPAGMGRVKLELPWLSDPDGSAYSAWARIATLMAGADRGTWFIPEVNDEVLVAFEAGDARRPFVLGGLWNGSDFPPETMDGDNNIRSITWRSGIKLTFDDTSGGVTLTAETPGGQRVVLKDSPSSIELADANGNTVKMESAGITLTTAAKLTVSASTVEITASMVTVNSGMSTFSGVVKSDTNITNSTVSVSYTPGAGNIW